VIHTRTEDGTVREKWDDDARVYTSYAANGAETGQRPYNAIENERADTYAAQAAIETATLEYRRAVGLSAPDELAALQQAQHAASGVVEGAPWVQPTGAHNAYPIDWVATHKDKTWVSLVAANVWEPGVSGWREEVAEGYPEWVQPTGAHDAYNLGDRVSWEGIDYESTMAANVWGPPPTFSQGWAVVP
jgi:hypothetical protein